MSRLVCALAFAAVVALGVSTPSIVAANLTKYHVSDVTMRFSQAYAHCKRHGWALATERTPEATQAINDAITASGAGAITHAHYLGGFNVKGDNFYPAWIWLDDGKDFEYTNWMDGQESSKYDCLIKHFLNAYSGQWSTGNGSIPQYFICESE